MYTTRVRLPSLFLFQGGPLMAINGTTQKPNAAELALNTLCDHDLLTQEEEIYLSKLFKESGSDADRNKIVKMNIRLVTKIARRYINRGMPLLDIVSHGNIGLIRAIEKFDPTQINPQTGKPYRLSTYATWWIRQSIERAIMNEVRTIRLPVHIHKQLNLLWKTRKDLEKELGREATLEELANALELDREEVRNLNDNQKLSDCVSESILIQNDELSAYDIAPEEQSITPLESAIKEGDQQFLNTLISQLKEQQQVVLIQRFGLQGFEPHTLEEVGTGMNLTRERIRQIESEALRKMRFLIKQNGLNADILLANNS